MKGMLLILALLAASGCTRMTPQPCGITASHGELHGSDFDGQMLNDTGRGKIDALPRGEPAVVVIHMSRSVDRHVYVRRAREVRTYARDRGVVDAQVRFDPAYADDTQQQIISPAGAITACVAADNR